MFKKSLLSLAVIGILVGCGGGEDRQASYLQKAQEHFAEENFEKAKVDARNVLQINPKNLEARLILADISFKDGDIRKAYGGYQGVLTEDENNIDAHAGLAKIFLAVRDFDQALSSADKVLAVDPQNDDALGLKAMSLAGLNELGRAVEVAESALSSNPANVGALGVISQSLVNQDKLNEALDRVAKAQSISPDDNRIALMKIALLERAKDNDALETELIELASRNPEIETYSTTLVRYYIRESKIDEAEQEVRNFASNNETVESNLRVAGFLLQQRSQEAAIAELEQLISKDGGEYRYKQTLAQVYLFAGDQDKGIETLREMIDSDPRSVGAIEARNSLVSIYLNEDKKDKARELVDEVLDIEPENTKALMVRAAFNLDQQDIKAGIADLRVVLRNEPENIQALKALAKAQELNDNDSLALDNYKKLLGLNNAELDVLGSAARLAIKAEQYEEAERYIRFALEKDADNASLVTNLIRLLVLKEDYSTAKDFANRLIESENSKALGYFLVGGLNVREELPAEAIKNFKLSLAERPNAVETLTVLAQTVQEKDGVDAAMTLVADHCETYPKQPQCHYILGTLHAQKEQWESAISALDTSLSLNDKLVATYRQLARVHGVTRNLPMVKATIQKGIDATNDAGLSFDLAGLYYGLQEYENAAEVYENMLLENKENVAAKNNLAMIYAENLGGPENLKKANALAADLKESDNPAYLDTVGWVAYLSGDYQQAITFTRAAVDKLGSSPLLQYHLGMAYYKAGDLTNAKTYLAKATETEQQYIGYEEAVATLASLSAE